MPSLRTTETGTNMTTRQSIQPEDAVHVGAHRALCEQWAIVDLFSLTAKVTAVTAVFPCTGQSRFLLSPKTQITNEPNLCFTLKMSDCCLNLLFLPCGHMLPWRWVVFRVVTGKLTYD